MRLKRLLIYVLLTNLLCAFPAGHAVIFLGLFEPILVAGALSGDNESQTMWVSSAILLLSGQLSIIIGLIQRTEQRLNQLGLAGILILSLAIVSVYYTMHEQLWTITLLTAIPFIIVSLLFSRKVLTKD